MDLFKEPNNNPPIDESLCEKCGSPFFVGLLPKADSFGKTTGAYQRLYICAKKTCPNKKMGEIVYYDTGDQ